MRIMQILISTGLYPPDIGGPAIYAKNLADQFLKNGDKVKVLPYKFEKKLPICIRHFLYFLRVVLSMWNVNLIIALDTFSVGFPTVLASKIFRKKVIMRIGGDFLWESYVERTGYLITLSDFYKEIPKLPLKQRLIFYLQKFALKNCSALAFNTEWQKKIFAKTYGLDSQKTYVIENFYPVRNIISNGTGGEKNFLWAGRPIKLKNINILKDAFSEAEKENNSIKLEISEKISWTELMKKIQNCYAVILPSLSDISPNFIIDAISLNKPFILTKETGLYEKLKDIGIFVNPPDKEDIKNKILFLAEEKNYNEYKNRIADFNFTHSWQEIADEFIGIYKKL